MAAYLFFAASNAVFAVAAPDITISGANCYRNLIDTGDIYCQLVYDMPVASSTVAPASPEEWSAYLVDQSYTSIDTGLTTGMRIDPLEPGSLLPNHAFIQLYRNYTAVVGPSTLPDASSILEYTQRVPRIDDALGGVYLQSGHAVTWAALDVAACVVSSDDAAIFTTQSGECLTVSWNTATSDTPAQRNQYGYDTVLNLLDLEARRSVASQSYVVSNLISTSGRLFVLESLSVADEIIPEYFQAAGGQIITEDYVTPTGSNALQTRVDTEAALTGLPTALSTIGANLFGISGGAFATILFVAFGGILFIIIYKITKEPVIPMAAFMTVLITGSFVRGPTVSILAVLVVVLSLIAAMFIFRRFAQ